MKKKIIWILLQIVVITGYQASIGYAQSLITTQRIAPIGLINFGANAVINASETKFVDGYVRTLGNTRFQFPIGNNNVYAPCVATGQGIIAAYYLMDPNNANSGNNFAGGPFSTLNKDAKLASVSTKEFWDINGSVSSRVTISWNEISDIASLTDNDLSKLVMVGWNGNQWTIIPSTIDQTSLFGTASSFATGSVTSNDDVSLDSYQIYSFASLSAGALPVTLVSFKAYAEGETAVLNWNTSTEYNSSHFEIQHSDNGKFWNKIGQVLTQENNSSEWVSINDPKYSFIHTAPAYGKNYYRLKMIDKDQTSAYSTIQTIDLLTDLKISIYPNPASDKLFIKTSEITNITAVVLRNFLGTVLYKSVSNPSEGINTENLLPGTYLLSISTDDTNIQTHKIIINR